MKINLLTRTFSSLSVKNFRYFWLGQCVSVMGTWIQRTASIWLAYRLTGSAFLVGLLTAGQFIPILALTLIAGSFSDRFSKKKILIITQSTFLLLGLIMTLLVFFKVIVYGEILLIVIVYGIFQSLDTTARQSYVFELVGQKNLLNGISLNSSIFNLARIIGPGLAGMLIVTVGMTWCFFLDTVSYLAVLTGLFLIHQKNTPVFHHAKTNLIFQIKIGLKYVFSHPDIKLSAWLMLIICSLDFNMNVIAPIYAKTVLHSGAQVYSNILSATGVGSLIGAFLMSYLARLGVKKRMYLTVGIGTSFLQCGMFFIHTYLLSLLVMVGAGFCNMIFLNQSNASFQFDIPNNLRGRIMSVYVLLNQGTTPIGSLYAGGVMDLTSGQFGFPACGLAAIIGMIIILLIQKKTVISWTQRPKTTKV